MIAQSNFWRSSSTPLARWVAKVCARYEAPPANTSSLVMPTKPAGARASAAEAGARHSTMRAATSRRRTPGRYPPAGRAERERSVVAHALPDELGGALHSLEGHRLGAQREQVAVELRESDLGVADPVRIRADLDVVDHGVLVGQHLERSRVGEVGADRLGSLFRRSTEDVGLAVRAPVGGHDLHRHIAVVVVEDVADRALT